MQRDGVAYECCTEILTHALAHLSPVDLSSISLVSHRFHELVTTPHAWRTAFSRYFPGPDSLLARIGDEDSDSEEDTAVRTERRAFTRLSSLASWRSEYILRTRLLRSLARGKPVQTNASPAAARAGQNPVANSIIMYNSQMFTTVNHMHASFGNGLNKRPPRFVHAADDVGTATSSDPATGKIDSWGLGDPTTFLQFTDRYPGDSQYGLGPGDIVGVPNSMDVSQPFGMVHGEGSPHGLVYYRSTEEMRGRLLAPSIGLSVPELGIPKVLAVQEAVCSVWIAKSSEIPSLTDGLIGILAGTSLGVLTAYSLGPLGARDQRYSRGEVTARWVLSPGVPIIAIAVDEQYSFKRQAQNRIWAVALNALGEVFYLTKFPKRRNVDKPSHLDVEKLEELAWLTGRTVYWNIVEASRRTARPNPYENTEVDGSYTPQSSWDGMCLGKEQIKAETREIEAFLQKKPKDFQKSCMDWDMRRRLEVDFASDNDNDDSAGEAVAVFTCGGHEDTVASVKRYIRCKVFESRAEPRIEVLSPMGATALANTMSSLFGGPAASPGAASPDLSGRESVTPQDGSSGTVTPRPSSEEWRASTFSFGGLKSVGITATSIDCSTFATTTKSEDPLLNFSGQSTGSSPSLTPLSQTGTPMEAADIPGQRARLVAAGTKMGAVLVWNMRAAIPQSDELVNEIDPVRIIYTDSPEISCLGLTSLYVVHGGNDGLVQAWDPLASSSSPIRTLNSRFSSRARRRLVQAQASPQGVGINMFAAGAICLDPDPTVLRGMVSIGTHLRYWSYSSSAADQYKSHKRRLRRSERGSNFGGERFPNVPRGNFKDYIANEKLELEQETKQQAKEAAHLAGRFGTELLGSDASEEEVLAYAKMLSEEAATHDAQRRSSCTGSAPANTRVHRSDNQTSGTETTCNGQVNRGRRAESETDEGFDADLAEAIRQSLAQEQAAEAGEWEMIEDGWGGEDQSTTGFDIPIRYGRGRKQSPRKHSPKAAAVGESSNQQELSDLEFALQLSLAEEQSKKDRLDSGGGGDGYGAGAGDGDGDGDGTGGADGTFPALSPTVTQVWRGKGKGKGRAE